MEKELVQKHREDFRSFMANVSEGILPEHPALEDEILTNIRQKLREDDFKKIEDIYTKNQPKSYINAFRTYLEKDHPKLFYRYVLRVIEEAVRPRFEKDYPSYAKAVRTYLRFKPYETVEAGAEWRAYFESRFYGAIERFFEDTLPDHKLTLNLLLWSFLGQEILPIYRQDINYKANNPEDKKLFDRRQEEFLTLSAFREEYSFVWDIVQNNVTTIFYFDKVEAMSQMVVYEIDPYVDPGKGDVYARYASKNIFSIEHRDQEKVDLISPEKIKKGAKAVVKDFEDLRKENQDEKKYQYQAIRFFIRSGILNPLKAAYYRPGSGSDYVDLLENAPSELIQTVIEQYKTSTGRLPVLKNEPGKEDEIRAKLRNKAYKYDEKYSKEENEALDKVIEYIDENEPGAISARIAVFEAGFFSLTKDVDSKISDIYWMPVLLNWKDRNVGGSVFINTSRRIAATEKDLIPGSHIEKTDKVPQKLISALYFLSGLLVDKQIGEIEDSIRAPQERAAAVSVMSRNISHNLGSHVLSYLRNRLSDERLMLQEGVFQNLLQKRKGEEEWEFNQDILKENDSAIDLAKFGAPYLRSLGQLLGYFQERQDYIGTLASDWRVYYSPINFKREVADFFSKRHEVKKSTQNSSYNLILDFIAHSEGYKVNDVDIRWYWNDAEEGIIDVPGSKMVALPSGITGRQGIYTILENFMRNSAKHGQPKTREGDDLSDSIKRRDLLQLTLILSDAENPNYYKIQIKDNSGNANERTLGIIRNALKTPLIGPDGTPDERHKGIKEIQIAAAWLRGISPSNIADEFTHDGLDILTADEEGGDLCYTFYLKKPKPVLFVVQDKGRYTDAQGALKPEFKHFIDWDIVQYALNQSINPDKALYHMVLVEEKLGKNRDVVRQIRAKTPVRLIYDIKMSDLKDLNVLEHLYKRWLDGYERANKNDEERTQPRFALAFGKERPQINSKWHIGIDEITDNAAIPGSNANIVTGRSALEQRILFRHHNDTPAQFADFMKAAKKTGQYGKYAFVEGISANNSTARLLREETRDEYWHLKMLEVALTKILIFDERIWKNLRNEAGDNIELSFERLKKKNIYVLNLEKRNGKLVLVDLMDIVIAQVRENGAVDFVNDTDKELHSRVHFISVHQGLLDRVYKHCEKADESTSGDNLAMTLFSEFKKSFWAYFRCVIHSGRSKTPNLPPNTAFLQFSSLYAALSDCKASLCDLLYSTIEE